MIYDDGWVQIYKGNSIEIMNQLPEESVQCVVTSPPYWGLRKYDGEQEILGWGCAYGLEPTPEQYIAHTVEFLRGIRRVLRKDGVVFWNIGDSYVHGVPGGGCVFEKGRNGSDGRKSYESDKARGREKISTLSPGMKPKDLCLIPFRVAIAAQEDGWWVRSVVIWSKPNPMPESVEDRPTNSHEYIFIFTKSNRYYWDIDAVREPHTWIENRPSGMARNAEAYRSKVKHDNNDYGGGGSGFQGHSGGFKADGTPLNNPNGRNLRSVWEFPTEPYPEAHFAVFPTELPKRCIMAASREGDTILDPFGGSGTVGEVAKSLGRKAILIDTSEKYCRLAIKRCQAIPIPMELNI